MGEVLRFLPGPTKAQGELVHPSSIGVVKRRQVIEYRRFHRGRRATATTIRRCMGVGSGTVQGESAVCLMLLVTAKRPIRIGALV